MCFPQTFLCVCVTFCCNQFEDKFILTGLLVVQYERDPFTLIVRLQMSTEDPLIPSYFNLFFVIVQNQLGFMV